MMEYATPAPWEGITPEQLGTGLAERSYLADEGLLVVLHIALKLRRPLLLEGAAGVGKTELAKALAGLLGSRLVRLQCYEGIDVAQAVYDWNYPRQMLYIRTLEAAGAADPGIVDELFGPSFLVRRPLLEAISAEDAIPPLLLIDEIDRADDEFEAFLLEMLADFQITIPELGTIRAATPPIVILTSNRTRELHDALKRRCLYHWIGYPSLERETEIIHAQIPAVTDRLAREAARFVHELREAPLTKPPGTAETLDWVNALVAMGQDHLEPDVVRQTLGAMLKHPEDLERAAEVQASVLGPAGPLQAL